MSEGSPPEAPPQANPLGGLPVRALLGYYLFGYTLCVLTLASHQIPPLALVVNSVLKAVLLALIVAVAWGFLWVYLGSLALRGRITFRDSQTLTGSALLLPGIIGTVVAVPLAFLAPVKLLQYAAGAFALAGFITVGVSAARANRFGALRDLLFLLWFPFLAIALVILAAVVFARAA